MHYFRAKTVEDACSLLSKYKEEAEVIAGGTDLLVQMKDEEVMPKYVIDIGEITGQDYIIYDEGVGLRIGAQATIHAIASSPLVREKFGILASAASSLGSPQIRHRATMAGNLCNASPSAETVPPLMVSGASVRIVRTDGERIVPVENFSIGPGQTVLNSGEIVAEIIIPPLAPRSGGAYLAHTVRKVQDLAIVNVAVLATVDGDVISDARIALGAIAPTVIRAKAAEAILKGKKLSDSLLQEAGQAALDESYPIDDVRSSAKYRREIIKVLVARAVKQAVEQVKAGQ